MKTSDFDFELPEHLIAKRPVEKRDRSRLLVLNKDGSHEDRLFCGLPEYINEGDIVLLNKTRVLPFNLRGIKPDGKILTILLVKNISGNVWEILSRGRYTGKLEVSGKLSLDVKDGTTAALNCKGELVDILWECGDMPLPPYIKRRPDDTDKARYQTVYAEDDGSIAAPTAGLHFTEELLDALRAKGAIMKSLTLHVGRGTFTPIRTEYVEGHSMESENFEVDAGLIEEIKNRKGRLFAVGTTATRAIEGLLSGRRSLHESRNGTLRGSTDIFIHPGYRFRAVDCLITNFHLPRSTPLMLASALCGRENLLNAYRHTIKKGYRFFSYGDAMLIL